MKEQMIKSFCIGIFSVMLFMTGCGQDAGLSSVDMSSEPISSEPISVEEEKPVRPGDATDKENEAAETIDAPVISGYEHCPGEDADGIRINWNPVKKADGYEYRFTFISNVPEANDEEEITVTAETSAEYYFQDYYKLKFEVRACRNSSQKKHYSEWTSVILNSNDIEKIIGVAKQNEDVNSENEEDVMERLKGWARSYYERQGVSPQYYDCEANGDGTYTIHVYDIIENEEEGHTGTTNWLYVDANGKGTDLLGEDIDIHP